MDFFCIVLFISREEGDHPVKKVAETEHVDTADADRITQSKFVELVQVIIKAKIVNLVHNKKHRFGCLAEHVGDIFVISCQAVSCISEKTDNICQFHCNFGLFTHLAEKHIIAFRIDSSGIDQRKGMPEPFSICRDSVTGDSGHVIHNADTFSGHFVEKSGFADIGPAYDSNKRFSHLYPPFPIKL